MIPQPDFYKKDWLQKWAVKPMIDGFSVKDILMYKGISMWHFVEFLLHYQDEFYDRVFPPHCSGVGKVLHNIDFKKKQGKRHFVTLKLFVFYKMYLITRIYLRLFCSFFKQKKRIRNIAIISSDRFSSANEQDNKFWGSVIKELKHRREKYDLIEYDQIYNIKTMFNSLNRKKTCLADYYSFETLKEIRELAKFLQKAWKLLKNNENFKKSLVYKGHNLYGVVSRRFEFVLDVTSWLMAEYVCLPASFVKTAKPKMILVDQPENYYAKGCIAATRGTKTKVVSLQYEYITSGNSLFSSVNQQKRVEESSKLPDRICVWSPKAKENLIKWCGYPNSIIKVTGNPMFDKLKEKKNIWPNITKKVLYATSCNLEVFKSVVKELSKLNCFCAIKPHPLEDINQLKSIISNLKCGNIHLFSPGTPIYALISASDLVIVETSTVGLESMIKGVPVLILNPHKLDFPIPYQESGAPILQNTKNIKKYVNLLLFNKKARLKVLKGMHRFVYQQAYKTDGKSAKRVVDEIKSFLSKHLYITTYNHI